MKVKSGLFRTQNRKKVLTGAAIGAGIGAVGGAVYGNYLAQKEIEKVPVESVTLSWKEPVYEHKVIGRIPEDYYEPAFGGIGWGHHNTPTEPVIRPVPVKDETGKVVYRNITKTFTGHGKPFVQWNTKEVREPIFNGWDERVVADYDVETYVDSEGNTHTYQEVRGYWHYFYPRIRYNVIDTYQVPDVKFEHGVNVAGKVLTYAALGAVIGGVAGGVIAALLDSTSSPKGAKEKKVA